jgi:hypothetical protein
VAQEPGTARTLAKQFATGLGISVLLPLTVWYGVALFHPPPDRHIFFPDEYSMTPAPAAAPVAPEGSDEKADTARREREERQKRFEAEERLYYRAMFFVAYPVGLTAILVGALLRVQAVGAGLMFGGLGSLAEGCYSYWDKLGDSMRFGSLLLALAVVIIIGWMSFRPKSPASTS